jgi:hypothetical protein
MVESLALLIGKTQRYMEQDTLTIALRAQKVNLSEE